MSDEYSDEDFENYDDEFEAEDDYEVLPAAITRTSVQSANATTASPQHPASPLRPRSGMQSSSPSPYARPVTPLNIPAAPVLTDEQRAKANVRLTAALKKWPKLQLQVVVLDELFTMGSLSEYELSQMGRSIYAGKKVGTTQTNDDAKEEECQTDEIDMRSYASQAPDDRNAMTEDEVNLGSVSATVSSHTSGPAAPPAPVKSAAMARITHMEAGMELKLNAFIAWAGPVVLAALGVSINSKVIGLQPDPHGGQGLGAGMVPLAYPALLSNRPVNSVAFVATAGEPLMLAAYGPVGAELGAEVLLKDHSLASKGCMCVWDLSAPSTPKAVLVSEGTPTCCGFAPAPASHVVFAGMEEGGVCLWDIEEPASNFEEFSTEFNPELDPDFRHGGGRGVPVDIEETASRHPSEQVGADVVCTRRPSYTSECSLDMSSSGAPIVSVVAVLRGGSRVTPCYLYSLTAWGDVTIWTVNLLTQQEAAAMDMDLGMRVGSCVRLLKVAANIRLGMSALWPPPAADSAEGMAGVVQSSALQVLSQNQRHFLVGADGGRVLKGSWVGLAAPPKEYVPHDHGSAAVLEGTGRMNFPSCVTDIHVSPFCPWAFLSGHDDGTVTLHSLALATAALVWPGVAAGGVKAVRWSPSRPCVFFVLDAMCTISCFDLTVNRSGPTYSQSFMATDPSQPGMTSLATCLEVGSLSQSGQSVTQLPGFAVGYDDGRVDFLAFSRSYVQQADSEGHVLADIVGPEPRLKGS